MSYLADVQMPVKEEVNLDTEEETPNFQYSDDEVDEEEEEVMPVVEARAPKEKYLGPCSCSCSCS